MFWYNEQLIEDDKISLDITDSGLIYGATVFTTLRVYQQSLDHPLTHWQLHLERLQTSLKVFNWSSPNWKKIRKQVEILLPHYPIIRIVIFADGREWITGRFLSENLPQNQQRGIKGWVANDVLFQRSLANYKTGNYLGAWLALQEAKKLGATEAILIDTKGNWLETSTGNLWGWKNDCWFTPTLSEGILPGIIRKHLLTWLNSQEILVKQIQWTREFMEDLEVIAYSNCGVEIIPFSEIFWNNKKQEFKVNNPILEQLRGYFAV